MKTVRTNSRNWDTDPKDGLNHNPIKFDPSTFKLIKWKNPSGFNVGNQVKYAGDFKLLQDKIGTVTEVVNRNLLICEFEGGIITDVNPSELISFRLNGFTDSSTPSSVEWDGKLWNDQSLAGFDVANDVDSNSTVIYVIEHYDIQEGDRIEKGDEYFSEFDNKWLKSNRIGEIYGENFTYKMRRIIKKPLVEKVCQCTHEPKTKLRLEGACENCKKEFYKWLETQENAFDRIADTLPDLTLDLSRNKILAITELGSKHICNFRFNSKNQLYKIDPKEYKDSKIRPHVIIELNGEFLKSFIQDAKKEGLKVMIINLDQPKKQFPKSEYVSKKLPKVFLKEDGDVFIVAFEGEDVISQHLNDFTAPTWLDDNKFSMNIKFFGLIKTILELKNIDFKIIK